MAGASVLRGRGPFLFLGLMWVVAVLWPEGRGAARAQSDPHRPAGPVSFKTGAECMACHNGLTTPSGRGRLDRRELARHDDGQLLARSLLAGARPARGDRSSGACRGDRGRVLHLPHADDHAIRPAPRAAHGRGLRAPADRRPAGRIRWPRTACRARYAIRSQRATWHARELHRRLRRSTSPVLPARSRCSVRSRSMRARTHHAVVDRR